MDNFRDSYFPIEWDLSKKRIKAQVWGKQYDAGRGLSVTVISGGQVVTPTNEVLRLKWEKPDNTSGYVNSTIIGGKFIIENIAQMFTVSGSIRADLEMQVGGEFVASVTFYATVEKAVAVDAIESSSEFTALQDAIAVADDLVGIRDEFDSVIANATVDSEVILARGAKPTLLARLADIENGTGLNDNAISPLKIDKSEQLSISDDLSIGFRIPDKYVAPNGGLASYPNTTTGGVTDFLAIIPGDIVKYFGYTNLVGYVGCIYNANKVFIGNLTSPTVSRNYVEMSMPENAAYIRVNYAYASEADFYVKKYLSEKYKIDWLAINGSNIDDDSIDFSKLSQDAKDQIFDNSVKLKYGHSLAKPFDFPAKTLTAFGDSIVAGTTSPSLGSTDNPFIKVFANKFGMNYATQAVGGTYITDTVDANSILNKILNYTTQRDFIFIAGGTNDWTQGKPLGALGDTTGATFYGALDLICNHLKTNHPNTTVIFITPINQNVSRPNAITTMDAYRNAIFEVATKYGFNVVDGSQIGFPKEQGAFANVMCSDGVHPSELGHSFYAKSLMGILV